MLSKKLFFFILGTTGALVLGVSLFAMRVPQNDPQEDMAQRETQVRARYEEDVNALFDRYLFGDVGKETSTALQMLRSKLLALRAPKELRDLHMKIVTTLDTFLQKPEEAVAAPSALGDIVAGETWFRMGPER